MIWMKAALPVAMAVAGVGAAAVAVVAPTRPPLAGAVANAWIDGPTGDVAVAPGVVTVTAHATAEVALDSLELYVDGDRAATDGDLGRSDRLVLARFRWEAQPGRHLLVVRSPTTSAVRSDERVVEVVEGAPAVVATTTTTIAGVGDGSSTTTSADPSPNSSTTTAPVTTTSAAPTTTAPGPAATVVPQPTTTTTAPPRTTTTTAPSRPPVIDAASMSGTIVHEAGYCPDSVTVTARARDATSGEIAIAGVGRVPMARSGTSFTGTIRSGFPSGAVGDHQVTVIVTGSGGSASRVVGTLTIASGCPKD
ncbi:MAG: hypothetical protein R2702_12945 [Acidimicrobiales bacterium]